VRAHLDRLTADQNFSRRAETRQAALSAYFEGSGCAFGQEAEAVELVDIGAGEAGEQARVWRAVAVVRFAEPEASWRHDGRETSALALLWSVFSLPVKFSPLLLPASEGKGNDAPFGFNTASLNPFT
jgi:hypothetical protein